MQIYGKDFKKPNIEAKKIEAILTDRFNSTKFFKKNPNRNKKIKNRTKLIFLVRKWLNLLYINI